MPLDTSGASPAVSRHSWTELRLSLAIAIISIVMAALVGFLVLRGDAREADERWSAQVQHVRAGLDEKRLIMVNHIFDEITDLGGVPAISIFTFLVGAFLLLSRLYMPAMALLATTAASGALDYALKEWIQR